MNKFVIDEKTINNAKMMDEDSLEEIFAVFKPKIREMSVKYFLAGADRDDVIQEAMIALFGAVRSYNPEKNDNFYAFAVNCIDLRMKSAVKKSLRKKHSPLNQSLSIDEQPELGNSDIYSDPEEEYINNESYSLINEKLKSILSPYEQTVVSLLSVGMKISEISSILGKTNKSVDNAIQRIRKKSTKQNLTSKRSHQSILMSQIYTLLFSFFMV